MSKVLIVFSTATYSRTREGLDLVLGLSSFIEDLTVVFKDEGLRLLFKGGRVPQCHGERDFFKTMGMFELYDISDIRVVQDSLVYKEYVGQQPDLEVTAISQEEFVSLLASSQHKIMI